MKKEYYEERINIINEQIDKNNSSKYVERRISVSHHNIWLSQDEMGAVLSILRDHYKKVLHSIAENTE